MGLSTTVLCHSDGLVQTPSTPYPETGIGKVTPAGVAVVPTVEQTDPEGVDFGWVMQVTFVATIVVGAPLVAILSLSTALPSWPARAAFAIRVGAVVWFCTAIGAYLYARRQQT